MTKREAEKAVVKAAMNWYRWVVIYSKNYYVTEDDLNLSNACARLAKMRGKK